MVGEGLERSDGPIPQFWAEHSGATVSVGPRDDNPLEQVDVIQGIRRDGRLGENVLGAGREHRPQCGSFGQEELGSRSRADGGVGGGRVVCLSIPAGGFVEGQSIQRSVAGGGGQGDGVLDLAEGECGERVVSSGGHLKVVVVVGHAGGRSLVDRGALARRETAVDRLADEVVDERVARAERQGANHAGALCLGDGLKRGRHVDIGDRNER